MAEPQPIESDIFEVIGTQRAMRRLKPDPVPDEYIKKILWAATRAPSGGNRQGWRFIVIRDEEKKRQLQQIYIEAWDRYVKAGYGQGTVGRQLQGEEAASNDAVMKSATYLAEHLHESPVLILVCALGADASSQGITAGSSIYPAIQNLMLAARALGLGTALTTMHRANEPKVREILGIPETVQTAALIPVGWPRGKFGSGFRKPVEDVTYWETWGEKRK